MSDRTRSTLAPQHFYYRQRGFYRERGILRDIVATDTHHLVSTSVLAQLSVSAGWPLPEMHRPPTIIRCTWYGVWLYFRIDVRYRDVDALSAERDASTSLP